MRRGSWVVLLAALLVTLLAPPVSAGARGSFSVDCFYSHTLQADPIVFPDDASIPPASHSHDFFGNTTANASSTYASMVAGSTLCGLIEDKAGYWNPTGYLDGVPITPVRMAAYYFGLADGVVATIPAGLQMIAGEKSATSAAANPHVSWFCGSNETPVASHPYDCRPYAGIPGVDGVVGRVDFPECWNQVALSPADVAYVTKGCPSGYVRIPRLRYRVHFGIWDPCAGLTPCGPNDSDANVKLTLSTGRDDGVASTGAYYTLHADFWNTWDQAKLDQLVMSCLNAHITCGKQVSTTNQPPAATFTHTCSDLACTFTDSSTDPDGTVTAWSWNFGDGGTSVTQHPSHTYASAGTYVVSLTVTDNGGVTASSSETVVVGSSAGSITLSAIGYKVKGLQKVDLTWSPLSTSANVVVFRNRAPIAMNEANDGAYTDNINVKGSGTYTYKVCEASTATCSNEAIVVF